jgi:hypothetical protein
MTKPPLTLIPLWAIRSNAAITTSTRARSAVLRSRPTPENRRGEAIHKVLAPGAE